MSFWVAVLLSMAAAVAVLFALYRVYMPVKVLAPNKDIPAGAVIGQADIGYLTVARRDKHQLALTDPGQVIGKFARENLYAREPILAKKITSDISADAKNSISPEETTINLKQNEARWPQDVQAGETVTVVAVPDGGNPQVITRKARVLGSTSSNKNMTGTVEQIKSAVSAVSDSSITLALKWDQVGPLLSGKAQSKELWLLPEQEGNVSGDIYAADQPAKTR